MVTEKKWKLWDDGKWGHFSKYHIVFQNSKITKNKRAGTQTSHRGRQLLSAFNLYHSLTHSLILSTGKLTIIIDTLVPFRG